MSGFRHLLAAPHTFGRKWSFATVQKAILTTKPGFTTETNAQAPAFVDGVENNFANWR
jgi:hypothetical protein